MYIHTWLCNVAISACNSEIWCVFAAGCCELTCLGAVLLGPTLVADLTAPTGFGPVDLTTPGLGAGLLPKPLPGGLLTKASAWCVEGDGSGEGVYVCVHE